MKILLTGATGFIGSHIYKSLSLDHEVRVLHRGEKNLLNCNDNFDCLIHCASATPSNTSDPYQLVVDNISYAKNLVDFVKSQKIRILIYLSSMSVYGEMISGCVNEDCGAFDPSLYGLSKFMAEKIFTDYLKNEEVKKIFLRLPGVVGIGAKDVFLAKLRSGFKDGKEVTVYNSTQLFNNVLHVNSLVNYIKFILIENSQYPKDLALNMSSVEPIEVCEVIEIFKELIPSDAQVFYGDSLKPSFLISCEKAIEYGFIPSTTENSIRDYLLDF
ncbi:NAD(P)-dependent oxidoreductase [Polynucleobacter sp. MWH-UH23A]|uniref:NAD-dependent epimerase/dehydratase family protein n=1 Tax=Polynucleobacter sp. MWH-UH23A TaxID=1855613 RepID=UPI003364C0B3